MFCGINFNEVVPQINIRQLGLYHFSIAATEDVT